MSAENPKIFREKQVSRKNCHPIDDGTIETMKRYFKVEDHDALLDYIKANRIDRDSLTE